MTHCGITTIIGKPNAGKSTLTNQLTGSKVSIVSRKAQTTRMRVMGVLTEGTRQLILVDTPGLFKPRGKFEDAIFKAIYAGVRDADKVIALVDVSRKDALDSALEILENLKHKSDNAILVFNKIDLVPKSTLLGLIQSVHDQGYPQKIFMISAKEKDGINDLKNYLLDAMPEGPFLYPEDTLTDLPQRLFSAEITREEIFNNLHDEIPYQMYVVTDQWEPLKNGSVKIHQTLFVMQEKHRSMVLGNQGQCIKRISIAARKQLEELLDHPCHLFLHVKVDAKWQQKKELFHLLGLEY